MIAIGSDGKTYVAWVQNGIKHKRFFRSDKEAEHYQELLEDMQNAMKLAEEMERFNRDFKYDPKIVELKNAELGREIEELKERVQIKKTLQKKLGEATQKLAEQPRNVIDKASFMKEVKEIRGNIDRLDRFFKEHAIAALNKSLHEAVSDMKRYFELQKSSVREIEKKFSDLKKEVIDKLASIAVKDRVFSLKEAAEYLSVSRSSVESMMFEQGLPFFRIGNRYRIKEHDLKKWIEKRKERIHLSETEIPRVSLFKN